jgi:hypothetical protein
LTQQYGRYCARLVDEGFGDDVAEHLEEVLPELILTPWQELWLFEPLTRAELQLGPRLTRRIARRLDDSDTPPILRGRAALAAAIAGEVNVERLLRLIDTVPAVSRPDVIAAYAVATEGDEEAKDALAGLPDPDLAAWIFDESAQIA